MFFQVLHQDKKTLARVGVIKTEHGEIKTPMFMPVGTQATVKTIDSQDLINIKAQIILSNTYHLHLRPGEDLILQAGGLHKFMNWPKPILTDSGGFQVFSLGLQKNPKKNTNLTKITDNGVEFKSHLDGSKHYFTPETAIEIQHKLGADIIMAFDECTPDKAEYNYTKQAMIRTHDWAKRSLEHHIFLENNSIFQRPTKKQYLFGIIQGGQYNDLRLQSAEFINNLDFAGLAIGGESIGYNMPETIKTLKLLKPILNSNKPLYTMGVGLNPLNLLEVIEQGVDIFDCVAPTRLARHGLLFSYFGKKKKININNSQFKKDWQPIDKKCQCPVCQNYSRAYLHHLFKTKEYTGQRLATIHNLYFMINFSSEIQTAILNNNFLEFKQQFLNYA